MKPTLNENGLLSSKRSIRTYSGNFIDVFEPNPDHILIEDIAHALSMQPRFGGHLKNFYSVAQHSYLCYLKASPEEKYNALMHDTSEAYLLDMPKPIKLEMPDYNRIEDNLMITLSKKFDFAYPKTKEVERVDHYLLEWEWNILMLKRKDTAFEPIKYMSPKQAEKMFMIAYNSCLQKRYSDLDY